MDVEIFMYDTNIYLYLPSWLAFEAESLSGRHYHVFVGELWLDTKDWRW